MKQKIIICGAGRVGISITEHLSNEGFDITVIDSNSDAIQKATEFMMFKEFLVLHLIQMFLKMQVLKMQI